jgi:hypothetical protein
LFGVWQSICDSYSSTTDAQAQYQLVKMVVDTALRGNGDTIVGILNEDIQRPYFNGSVKFREASGRGVTPDFTANNYSNANLATLADHLYQFFGAALNCSQRGTNGFPSYAGNTMTAAHSGMNLPSSVFNAFNSMVVASANALGVAVSDQIAIRSLLGSFNRQAFATPAAFGSGTAVMGASGSNRICQDTITCPCATIAGDSNSYVGTQCLPAVITSPSQSICDRYTAAQSSKSSVFPQGLSASSPSDQRLLVRTLVNRAVLGGAVTSVDGNTGSNVAGIVNVGSNAPYFNGSLVNRNDGSADGAKVNFLANNGYNLDLAVLATHLYQFFSAGLGCSLYNNIGNEAYAGRSMNAAHAKMAITSTIFSDFNQQIRLSAQSYGVTSMDQASIMVLLNSFSRQQNADGTQLTNSICNQADCACATGYGLDSGNCVRGTVVQTSTGSTFVPTTTTTASSTGTSSTTGTSSAAGNGSTAGTSSTSTGFSSSSLPSSATPPSSILSSSSAGFNISDFNNAASTASLSFATMLVAAAAMLLKQ